MTTVQRPYINFKFNQEVDDGCLEYKSIPMAVVNDIVKVSHAKNEYTGIKQVYNLIPPRPKNLNVMATSIARLNNLSYSSVAGISKQFANEEVGAVKAFVNVAPPIETSFSIATPIKQEYIPEIPVRSSTGIRLQPSSIKLEDLTQVPNRREVVSTILGDEEPTSGVVPFYSDMSAQTEWTNNKLSADYSKRDIFFGKTEASAEYFSGGMDYSPSGIGHYREAMATQTTMTKPASGKNIETGMPRQTQRFFENSQDRFGTITGTPTNRLSREDQIRRSFGEHHTPLRDFAGDSATSGIASPNPM